MNSHYFILLFFIFEKSFGFKPNHQIEQQTKSIFSNKKCKETIIPARYKEGNKNIKFVQPTSENIQPEQYFPETEYPTNIMEASRPFFYNTGENNAILGPFPDDVRASYKSLVNKNKKSIKLKSKYMNDFTLDTRNCNQENTDPTPREEKNITKAVLKNNDNDFDVHEVEVKNKEIPQNKPLIVEDIAVEEIELTNTESESEETIEDEAADNSESESEGFAINYNVEEEIIAQGLLQSWESDQFFSEEIITIELSQETLFGSEEIVEEIDNSGLLVESVEEMTEVLEPENPEMEVCPVCNTTRK